MPSKEEIKAMFEQERAEAAKVEIKPISEKPTQPGSYNIQIRGVMTFMPIFMDFDGKDWVDLDLTLSSYGCNDISEVSYYDNIKSEAKRFYKRKP